MPKVSKKAAGKIGLFSAIMILFGAVVGIGIFFKNSTVFDLNNNNWLGVLLSWIISVVIILCTTLSFAEISTVRMSNRNAGFGGWSQTMCNYGFGRYSKIGYSFAFYSMNTFAVVFFAGEAILNCFAKFGLSGSKIGGFNFGPLTTFYIFISGGGLFLLLLFLNYFASKGMKKFGSAVGIFKFTPMLMIVVLGIVFGVLNADNGILPNSPTPNTATGDFSLFGMTRAIPSILFAYEGFLVVGNISGEMENPRKEVPLAVVLGIVIISALYLLITVGCMFAGTGNVYELMDIIPNETISKVLTYVMSVFIYICLIGTLNALIFSGARGLQAICEDGTIFMGKKLVNKKPDNPLFAGIVLKGTIIGFWWLVTIVPSCILNTDCIADAPSVVMVIYLYIIYFVNILFAFINRFTLKHETRRFAIFPFAAIIAMLGALLVIGVAGVYNFAVLPGQHIHDDICKCGWGLFAKTATIDGVPSINYLSSVEVIAWFWGMFGFIAAFPFINDFCIKHWDRGNRSRLIWEKANQ